MHFDSLSGAREAREHKLFRALLHMVPNLEERVMNGSQEEVKHVADLVGLFPFCLLHIGFQFMLVAAEGCLQCQV